MRSSLAASCAAWLAAAAALVAQHPAAPLPPALEPASSGGLEAVDRALAKLSVHKRLLVVGAHPDDEDNSLLAWVSRGLGGEAAYLSLSRGEGGQNLIGPELGIELGAVRTGELLAARRIEGTRQLFARGYDFGYTRSLEETFARWPREALLADAVRAVRRFKPQVMVAIFPPDARAGHGQHQASAVIAAEAFEAAGDPGRFPELAAEGLAPWRPEALFRRAWRREEATHEFDLGRLEPLSGRSLAQIAAASRSMHRSQDMGREQPIGPAAGGLVWLAGGAAAGATGPFDGLDTRPAGIAAPLAGSARREVAARLDEVEALARAAREGLSPAVSGSAVPSLARIVTLLGEARSALGGGAPGELAVADLLDEKLAVAEAGLAAAAGVVIEALADREAVAIGGSLAVEASVWRAGKAAVEVLGIELASPAGWEVAGPRAADGKPGEGMTTEVFDVRVAAAAGPTVPYFLRRPLAGDLYDWSDAPPAVRGEPLGPPPLVARFRLTIAGAPATLEREVVHRYGDQAVGEVRRPLRAVPRVEVTVDPELMLVHIGGEGDWSFGAVARSNGPAPVQGTLRATPPPGWRGSAERAFEIGEPSGTSGRVVFALTPPPAAPTGRYRVTAAAELEDGSRFTSALAVVEHPHVRPIAVPREAAMEISAFQIRVPELSRVGYVAGPSDRVPRFLTTIGVPVRILSERELAEADLSAFDAVVVGSRAYETVPELGRANGRLLDYVRGGGLVVVQYQQYQFVDGGFAPYPLEIARPHDRVTDEASPVRALAPEHPALRRPNAIGEEDWEGWVQERGLYFARSWDPAYAPLLALRDPGEPEQLGALLVARLGEGTWVYTGLSFFRQLPAGVPGAFRLFANLLALGEG